MPLQTGQTLNNRYRIVKLLGQGGFGAVYRAWDINMRESVALKENLETSSEAENQFQTEARLLFKLRHSGLPAVHDFFVIPGQGVYLVMDFIDGENLETILGCAPAPTQYNAYNTPMAASHGLPENQVIPWILQVCEALQFLHSHNPPVIHRDIKPANIRITPQGRAVLVDFGIAKLYDANRRTTLGARAATDGYSPPEQYGGGSTNERSDIYALGATLYHLLSGVVPPPSLDVLTGQIPPPRPLVLLNPAISPAVGSAVMQALELDARNRPGSMTEFAARLRGTGAAAPPPYVQPAPYRMSAAPAVIAPQAQPAYPTPRPIAPVSTPDISLMRKNLDDAIRRYMGAGYDLKSRLESSAILERKKPASALVMIFWILLFWPVALIYAFSRGSYTTQLNLQSDGRVDEMGGTLEKLQADKKRANLTGWILLGLLFIAFACIMIAASQ